MDTHDKQGIEWHPEALPRATQRALDYLSREPWLKRSTWYLAGGTALALQIGHRASFDLDFFTAQKDFSASKVIGHFPQSNWVTELLPTIIIIFVRV